MGQALYRKYRSRSLDEVVGQDHVVKTLKATIASGRVSHAYLFTGPKGVGKTSVARILAHEVNSLPYSDESIHLDIIEIDGASNRRIDEIRELRERVNIAPISAKYKVYIIDEVHMLTREAFNALLKTLEEPPAHCLFILATTEAHKLPETVVSRTQRFGFRPIDKPALSQHLKKIAMKEKINIEPQALDLLAEHGEGSFRDGIGMLDQLAGNKGSITTADVQALLGLPSELLTERLLGALDDANPKELVKTLSDARDQSVNPSTLAVALSKELRGRLAEGSAQPWSSQLLRELLDVAPSPTPYEVLEISLLDVVTQNTRRQPKTSAEGSQETDLSIKIQKDGSKAATIATLKVVGPKNPKQYQAFTLEHWPQIIELVKSEAASLYTALRLAVPDLSGSLLTLKFQFPLHQKKIDQMHSKNLVGQLIEDKFGVKLAIECVVDRSIKPPEETVEQVPAVAPVDRHFQSISNIFGAAELLES